jgi:tRNA pseudouridine55 synthase
MTKEINSFIGLDKSYSGKMIIGSSTPSYDLETKPNVFYQTDHINERLIYEKAEDFIGDIMQKPPIFSAVKKNGVRSYKLARKGEQVNLEKRKIIIRDFKITEINFPELSFEVDCSKGTYIRSLINDFGKALKSGAHLTELRRTKIGEFSVNDSLKIMDFIKTFKS